MAKRAVHHCQCTTFRTKCLLIFLLIVSTFFLYNIQMDQISSMYGLTEVGEKRNVSLQSMPPTQFVTTKQTRVVQNTNTTNTQLTHESKSETSRPTTTIQSTQTETTQTSQSETSSHTTEGRSTDTKTKPAIQSDANHITTVQSTDSTTTPALQSETASYTTTAQAKETQSTPASQTVTKAPITTVPSADTPSTSVSPSETTNHTPTSQSTDKSTSTSRSETANPISTVQSTETESTAISQLSRHTSTIQDNETQSSPSSEQMTTTLPTTVQSTDTTSTSITKTPSTTGSTGPDYSNILKEELKNPRKAHFLLDRIPITNISINIEPDFFKYGQRFLRKKYKEYHEGIKKLKAEAEGNKEKMKEVKKLLVFKPNLTMKERAATLFTLEIFMKACDLKNLTYFFISGSLIGAMRHQGITPWDEDIDVNMDSAQWPLIRDTLSNIRDFHLLTYPAFQWKFFWKYAPKKQIDHTKRSMHWPYIDIFFYRQNGSHIWNLMHNKHLNDDISKVFPLKKHRFEQLMVPVPRDAHWVIAEEYGKKYMTTCKAGGYNHKENRFSRASEKGTISCKKLYNLYPFVFKNDTDSSGSQEMLLVGNKTYSDIGFEDDS